MTLLGRGGNAGTLNVMSHTATPRHMTAAAMQV